MHDRYARADLTLPAAGAPTADRTTAWLFFEDERSDDLDAASTEEVAGLLLDHQIPLAILNACQSGQETGDPETGLGSRLLAAGVQTAGAVVARDFALFQAMQPPLQATLLAQKLRSERHLLILDSLESVTGDPLAIPNTLPPPEQAALRTFLADLLDGQTLVLLGSRGSAAWLQGSVNPLLRPVDSYALPGLDAEAAANLAERVLHRQVTDPKQRDAYAASPAFGRLLKLLDGSPLALEVVLSNLAHQAPDAILAALETGDVVIDSTTSPQPSPAWGGSSYAVQNETVPPPNWGREPIGRGGGWGDKTRSILACIDYAHSRLAGDLQRLLLTLFPFTGVIWEAQSESYIKQLQAQPALTGLPFGRWPAVLQAAKEWGLLTPHEELAGYLRIQPVLPYFLKTRLAQEPAGVKSAIETAFRLHYTELTEVILSLFEAQARQTGCRLTRVEYENLMTALCLNLAARVEFFALYATLAYYLDNIQDHHRSIGLAKSILMQMADYPPEVSLGAAGDSFFADVRRVRDTVY